MDYSKAVFFWPSLILDPSNKSAKRGIFATYLNSFIAEEIPDLRNFKKSRFSGRRMHEAVKSMLWNFYNKLPLSCSPSVSEYLTQNEPYVRTKEKEIDGQSRVGEWSSSLMSKSHISPLKVTKVRSHE